MLDHEAVLDANHIEDVDANRASRRCVPHVRTGVGARGDHAQPDGIAGDRDVLDCETEVRKRPTQRRDHGAHALCTGRVVGPVVLVLNERGRSDGVDDVHITLVEAFLDQLPDDVLDVGSHVPLHMLR